MLPIGNGGSMFDIEVDISDAMGDLDRLRNALADLIPMLQEAALYMERETKLNIARGQQFDGSPFAPLAASTLRTKTSGRILQETGAMVGSVGVQGVSSTLAKVGPSIDYAVYHQFGTSKMPARRFVGYDAGRHGPKLKVLAEDYLRRAIG